MSSSTVKLKSTDFISKVKEKLDSFYEHTIGSKWGNRILLILGIFIMLTYLFFFFFEEPIVNEEVRPEVTNNLTPWEVKEGDNFFKAMIERPFDLRITEYGQYRPRYLSFLIQFFEENTFLKLTRAFPMWGNRAAFFPLAMILAVISLVYFMKVVWKKIPTGLALFVSSTIVMFQNYQVATYWRARSAKLFAVSAVVFLLAFAIKNLSVKMEKKNLLKLLFIPLIFLLMTLDEQVLAISAMLAALSVLFCFIDKKINLSVVLYTGATILYGTFHLWWGKALFSHFTGGLAKHGHSIGTTIKNFNFALFKQAGAILSTTIGKVIFLSVFVFLVFSIYAFYRLWKTDDSNKEKIRKIFIGGFLFVSSIVLLAIMIDSHVAIYNIKCLWISVYPLVPTIILFLGFIYVLGNSKFVIDSIKPFVLLVGVSIALVYNLGHIDSTYYGAYLVENGGFMSEVTDLEVTENEIFTAAVPSVDMHFENRSIWASVQTLFTTENVKNAKIIKGLVSKKEDGLLIQNEFSCYLTAQKERKLSLYLSFDDYKKYESVSVSVNEMKLDDIKLDSNEIRKEFDVRMERYRANKVTIQLNLKDGQESSDVLLKELYMK